MDFADELLALAEPTSTSANKVHRKRTASGSGKSSSKRRKQEMSDDSDMEESDEESTGYYPLEGKFKNEADREELMNMSEIKREEILSKRAEEMLKDAERKKLERMVKSQAGGGGANGSGGGSIDPVSKAAKRSHKTTGFSKEKSDAVQALKRKRQDKESRRSKKHHNADSPTPRRQRSDTPSSDSDSEEGQVSRKGSDNSSLDGVQLKIADDKPTLDDLNKARVTRDMLERQCFFNQFEDFVKGGWVRLVVGMDGGEMVYRICEVIDVAPDLPEAYDLNNKKVKQTLELRHGNQTRAFPMSKISCQPFSQREFDRLVKTLETEKMKLPTRAKLEKKAEQIRNIENRIRTDAEISAMLARAKGVHNRRSAAEMFAAKSSLNTKRMLAIKRNDRPEIAKLDGLLKDLEIEMNSRNGTNGTTTTNGTPAPPKPVDALARVNERNRKANLEAMRRAEAEAAARKRKEAMMGGPLVHDLSARVKTVVKTRHDSRPATPGVGTPAAVPSPQPASVALAPPPPPSATPISPNYDALAHSVVIEELF